jgi:hypothetical protein
MYVPPPNRCTCAAGKECQACEKDREKIRSAFKATPVGSIEYFCPNCLVSFVPTIGQIGCLKKGQMVYCTHNCGKRYNDKTRTERYKRSRGVYR